jgi:4-amino-4-deoxy-L-arabinose transferase-like glycosyltransferase
MNPSKADALESSGGSERPGFSLLSARGFFLMLLVYFALQVVIRTLISGTVDLDESEQLILTQKFSWGYGSQPPLYTWLQILFFKSFGVSIFALALLKNLLLLSIYLFTYANVRFVTRSHVCGMLAAISLLFIPQVAWESQRDLTHSVLATVLVTATLFIFLRMRENSWRDYALFGLCAGLGILSKYNYVAFFFGLILSALTLHRFRALIWNKRIVLSLVICLAVLLPHLLWAFGHRDLLTATTYKFHQEQERRFISVVAIGLGRLLLAVLSHTAPLLLIFAAVFRKNIFPKSTLQEKSPVATFVFRKYAFILIGLVLAILLLRITGFKDRWFEPIFISLPLALFVVAQKWMERNHVKNICILGSVAAFAILLIIPGRIIFAGRIGEPQLLNAPFAQLKNELGATIPANALIFAESKWLGGNLRLQFPQRHVVTPELAKLYSASNRPCAVVWDATKNDLPKSAFVNFLGNFAGIDLSETQPVFAAENYQYFRVKKFQLGIATVNR